MTVIDEDVNETDLQSLDWSKIDKTKSNTYVKSSRDHLEDHKVETAVKWCNARLFGTDVKFIPGRLCKSEETVMVLDREG